MGCGQADAYARVVNEEEVAWEKFLKQTATTALVVKLKALVWSLITSTQGTQQTKQTFNQIEWLEAMNDRLYASNIDISMLSTYLKYERALLVGLRRQPQTQDTWRVMNALSKDLYDNWRHK